jgi:PIN like domain
LNDVGALFQSFLKDLEQFEAQQLDVMDEDSIRSSLDDLLRDHVGPPPTQKELDAIYDEGKERFANRMPPGFEDDSKQKDKSPFQFSNGLKIERRFGDLIVWKQAIALAKANQFDFLIFVTDDEKSDWWWKIDSSGPKTLGPRPELIEEIRRDGGVENFTIYSSESFMVAAKEYLGLDISQLSIEQIGDIQEEIRQRNVPLSESLPRAVFNWLQQVPPDEIVSENPGFPEFMVHTSTGPRGYEAQTISRRVLNGFTVDAFRRHENLTEPNQMNYILLARSAEKLVELKQIFVARKFSIPQNAIIIFGYLEFHGSSSTPTLRIDSCYDGLSKQWIPLGPEQAPEAGGPHIQ